MMQELKVMAPWPRRVIHFPIILIATVCQYVWAGCVAVDPAALMTTGTHVLHITLGQWGTVAALLISATMSLFAFVMPRRWQTLAMLLPQQGLLYLSAGAAAWAIYNAQFADGVVRSHAFLLVDQIMLILAAFFHTWAMMLILRYGED
jgi:hypothetical protein